MRWLLSMGMEGNETRTRGAGSSTAASAAAAADDGEPADVTLVRSVFPESCAPGGKAGMDSSSSSGSSGASSSNASSPLVDDSGRVCSGCVSVNGRGSCDDSDAYAGFPGAFRCLVEQAGDIAFVRAETARWFSRGGRFQQPWSLQPLAAFRILCPPEVGGCRRLTADVEHTNCTLGRVPSPVLMTRNSLPESHKLAIVRRLELAGTVRAWRERLYEGNNPFDHVLSGSAKGLVRVDVLTRAYLGNMGVVTEAVLQFNRDHAPPAREKRAAHERQGRGLSWTWVIIAVTSFVIIAAPGPLCFMLA